MVVKKTIKKAPAKVISTKPTVTVETKKISSLDSCCKTPCCSVPLKNLLVPVLLVLNTILLALVLVNQNKMEALRAGGAENYGLLKQVFQTEGYKMQQKQQLEQALQVLSQPQVAPQIDNAQVAPQMEEVEQVIE